MSTGGNVSGAPSSAAPSQGPGMRAGARQGMGFDMGPGGNPFASGYHPSQQLPGFGGAGALPGNGQMQGQQFISGFQNAPVPMPQQGALGGGFGFSNPPQFLSGSQNAPAPNTQSQVAQLSNSLGNLFGPGYQGQTSQSMLGGFGAGGQGQPGLLNGSFNGTQALGGFNGSQLGNMVQQNNPYQTQNFMQPPRLPGYAAPQATQPFNLGLGSFNGI